MKKWVVVGVFVLLGALGWVAWAQEGRMGENRFGEGMFRGRFGGHDEWGPRRHSSERLLALLDNDHVRESLGLSDAQARRLREIIVNTEKASVKTRADMAVRGIELRELLRVDKPDRETVMKKVGEISALREQVMKDHINALLEAKTVLTHEQQIKIRSFMERPGGQAGLGGRFFDRRIPEGPGRPPQAAPPEPPPAPPQP
jgi:hypothetical protein